MKNEEEDLDNLVFRRAMVIGVSCLLSTTTIVNSSPTLNSEIYPKDKKRILGQFFTERDLWLRPHIKEFIRQSHAQIAYDPFAGDGKMLFAAQREIPSLLEIKGLDIDESLGWDYNDSLIKIPTLNNAIILTNPPYISNYSARRKKINSELEKYFKLTEYDDLYLLALDRMLAAQEYVVAIVPETFINSPYRQKSRLISITILEENPFSDTDTPVAVLCFDGSEKKEEKIKIYKDEKYICTLKDVEDVRIKPTGKLK